jgi:hypothetical protein
MGNYGNITAVGYQTQQKDNDLQYLKQTIDCLRKEINEIKSSQHNYRSRARTPTRNENHKQQHSRTRSKSQVDKFPLCFYHHRYGAAARKCNEPCNFKNEKN